MTASRIWSLLADILPKWRQRSLYRHLPLNSAAVFPQLCRCCSSVNRMHAERSRASSENDFPSLAPKNSPGSRLQSHAAESHHSAVGCSSCWCAAVNDRESSVAIGVNNMSASTARARVGMRPQSRATKAEECRTIRSSSLTVGIYIHGWGKLLREHTGGCMK